MSFKLAHLLEEADSLMQSAEKHFNGKAVCLFGPYEGSPLAHFASIVIDNDLACILGMPTGGYGNTFE